MAHQVESLWNSGFAYCRLEDADFTFQKQPLSSALWHFLAPQITGIYMLLTGAYYVWKARQQTDVAARRAYNETAFAFASWGVIILVVYVWLKARFRSHTLAMQQEPKSS